MELAVKHELYYSNKNPIPIADVAESLLALEKIIKRSPAVLEKLFDGIEIQKVCAYIEKIESGSLLEKIVVTFIFGSQEKFDDFLSKVREKAGMDKLTEYPILPIIILALVLYGGTIASQYFNSTPENRNTIEANNNVIINLGAGMVNLTPEAFQAIVEGAVSNRADLAKDSVKILRPAKSDPEATVTFDNNPALSVQPETIRAIPTYLQEDITDEFVRDFDKVEITIRAVDLDSTKRGWAAVIPSIYKKRIPIQVDPDIDKEKLLEHITFIGDVNIVFQRDSKGENIPQKAYLRKVYIEDEE